MIFTSTLFFSLILKLRICNWWWCKFKRNLAKNDDVKITTWIILCGEVLDIHGYTGGYNITSALVTGHVAGYEAGKF